MAQQSSPIQYNAHLQAAILKHDIEWAQLSLQFGADANCCDEEGNTPLHLLLLSENAFEDEFFIMLMKAGGCMNKTNKKGLSVIGMAQSLDRWDFALKLASYNIDV